VIPIWGINSVTAVLTVYTSHARPLATEPGLPPGASKAGGVMIITFVGLGVAAPSLAGTTLVGGIPMALAAVAILLFGVKEPKPPAEQITAAALGAPMGEPSPASAY
jgi:MFS transporter, putative metabolite:H+ symporter